MGSGTLLKTSPRILALLFTLSAWIYGNISASPSLTITDQLAGLLQDRALVLVVTYDAADTNDPWKLFDPSAPAYVSDLTELVTGRGYWFKMSRSHSLVVPGRAEMSPMQLVAGWNLVGWPSTPAATPRVLPESVVVPTPRPAGAPTFQMITPYVNSSDIVRVGAFSSTANSPIGFVHGGIDFFPNGNLKPFRAVASGVVENIRLWQNDKTSNWQVNVIIRSSSIYSPQYAFEPFSLVRSDGQIQRDNILVSMGQTLAQGDTIGYLYTVGAGAHVDFSLLENGLFVCPESYFAPEARDSIMGIIRRENPNGSVCY